MLAGNLHWLRNFLTSILWSIKSNALRQSNNNVLTVAPFPSVRKDQLCSMLISAIVVEEFGMAPYWLSSRMFMTAGFTKPSTTNSSATLEIQGVRDIGVNSFWMSTTGFRIYMYYYYYYYYCYYYYSHHFPFSCRFSYQGPQLSHPARAKHLDTYGKLRFFFIPLKLAACMALALNIFLSLFFHHIFLFRLACF